MRAAAAMSLLRWPHDHHRDLRARLRAKVPPNTCRNDEDRYLMMLSSTIDARSDTREYRWVLTSSTQTRDPLHWPTIAPPIWSRNEPPLRSPSHPNQYFGAKSSHQCHRSNRFNTHAAAKSP